MRRTALAAVLGGLVLMGTSASAVEPMPTVTPATASLAARLSDSATATEYWDVTAWLDSGERFFARFAVTNQGPGVRTAAAVGHLVLVSGDVLPFQWGRRAGDWTLDTGGNRMKIAKARLDLDASGGAAAIDSRGAEAIDSAPVVVEIDSAKHGVELTLEIARGTPLVATQPAPDYGLDVAMPAAARGRIRARGAVAFRNVTGSGAVTHTWIDRFEAELLQRRLETFARTGDVATYLSAITRPDGSVRGFAVASRGASVVARADDVAFRFAEAKGDQRYPIAREWQAESARLTAHAVLRRELLRMDPLQILPQPFRMLLALGGHPQRVWSEGRLDLTLKDADAAPAAATIFDRAIVAATFTRASE